MRLLALLPAGLLLALAASAQPTGAPQARFDLCDYRLVWADEFNDASIGNWKLNGRRWIAHTPWAGDFGDARFADPGPAGPFAIRDGRLTITARKDRSGKWTSGLIAAADETGTGAGLRYGYFEARLKLPPGAGTWPAFWLMSRKPRHDPRPSVEIDGLEYYGHDPAAYQVAVHVQFKPPHEKRNRGAGKRIPVTTGSLTSRFVTIGIAVTPSQVMFLQDHVPVWAAPTPRELDTPLFPIVDLALGSGYPISKTPSPSTMEVDYVRIYAPAPGHRGGCQGSGQRPAAKRP
ncbi:MAG: glycoside hydrolase family 16 protein [Sphingomonadales bacterium]|nr:glycoside hydrolase family 16 protein [Sphingomonadales bacterium]